MRVLVTGGTGVVGRPAVDHLLSRGRTVRLLSRHAEKDALDWPRGVEPFQAHVGDAESLSGAVDGCDAVLHIAGIAAEDGPEHTFERVNVLGTENLLAEAVSAGAPRFVYVSSLGAERGRSDYHRSKLEAESLVRGYPGSWLIVRPGNVYGPGDEVISLLLKMVRTLPAVPVVGTGDQPFQPVWAEDVGLALALAVEGSWSAEVLEIAGDEVVTTAELLDRIQALTGRAPVRVPVPEWMALAGSELAESLGVDIRIHPDQLVMLSEGNVIEPGRPNALRETFGIDPIPLADGLARLADELPERTPADGIGALRRHRYWADVTGARLDAAGAIAIVRREIGELADPSLIQVGVEPGAGAALDPGETLTLAIPLRGNIQVRVEEVTEREVTAVTLEGHPLSGTVRFMAEDRPSGAVRFEVRTYTRPSSVADGLAMALVGESLKGAAWASLVEGFVARSGGVAADGVQSTVEPLDEDAARDVEEWVEALVRRRKARSAPA